jgi:addiction module HigA family antidote
MSKWEPDWCVSPGEILLQELIARDMSVTQLANQTGVPVETVTGIIADGEVITAEMAVVLECAVGIDAVLWNSFEQNYRDCLGRQKAAER